MRDIFIKAESSLLKLELDQIYYFTKVNNKVLAVFKNKAIEINTSLYNITNILQGDAKFMRTHKSFIVNLDKIKSINKYNENTYNIKFGDIKNEAFITKKNLNSLKKSSILV